ncbi:MAG: hypothetical protein ACYS6K_05345 [Planctomycetota bacterium]
MEDPHFRPEPVNADEVWAIQPGRHMRFCLRYLTLTAFLTLLVTLTATLGTMSSSSDSYKSFTVSGSASTVSLPE